MFASRPVLPSIRTKHPCVRTRRRSLHRTTACLVLVLHLGSPPYFTVDGPCTVDGACARSPDYPDDYGDSQQCTITPTSLAVGQLLSATAFDTESGYDKLIVNGTTYSGATGPSNVLLGSAFT